MTQKLNIEVIPDPVRRSIATISLDGDPWRNIHTSIFGKSPAFTSCTSVEQFAEQFNALEYRQAKSYAIKRLSLSPLPSAKLIKSLKDRLISEKVIETLINELLEAGYLNDKEWTDSFVRMHSQRYRGPRAIAQKLASKGLKSTYAEQLLQVSHSEEKQLSMIKHLLATRYRTRNLKDFNEKKRVVASLMRRGFDLSVILNCIEKI